LMAKFKGKNNQNSDLLISFNKDIWEKVQYYSVLIPELGRGKIVFYSKTLNLENSTNTILQLKISYKPVFFLNAKQEL
jgi:hypothetical protein